ncbi:Uncharacterised protein [Vibrio cholerae]|nr:Uncharacterised protein [Vibrio cholerae]CSB38943.1 Uncharacterised protein [Vibrio cholerae]
MSNRALAFCRPHTGKAIPRCECHLHAPWVGITNIFRGNREQTARDIQRVTACGNHPRRPVQRCIGIGTSNRFVYSGNQVIPNIALVIKARHFFTSDFSQ